MGLRERNATQTREHILRSALSLFVDQGYDATKMEDVAHRAEIGTTTLYRYFPTKELLVTSPLAFNGQMAAELTARPADEDLDLALGNALGVMISTPRMEIAPLRQLMTVVDTVPALQARLRLDLEHERVLLEQAIAEREDRAPDDPFCLMTARATISILEVVAARRSGDTPKDNAVAVGDTLAAARELLEQLRRDPPCLPRMA